MNIKFKTFRPSAVHDHYKGNCLHSATDNLNDWLKENPKVDIISWETTPVGTTNELYITIMYREWEG